MNKIFKNLERIVNDGEIEVLDSGPSNDVDNDVLETGADVVVDRGDDGKGPDDSTADYAGALGEAQQHQRSSCKWRRKCKR